MKSKNYYIILLLIIVYSFSLRWSNFWQMKAHNPVFDIPLVDSKEYVDDTAYYLTINPLGPPGSYFHPPLYSYFIAMLFKLFGRFLDSVKIFQILLDLVNLILIYLIAKKTFDERVALISAALYAMYIPIIQFSVEILPPILIIFLFLTSTASLLHFLGPKKLKKSNPFWLALSALSFGLLIITLPNFLICLPFILFWIFRQFEADKASARWINLLLFTLISLSPALLTGARNYAVAHEGVLISHNGGINFYIGNNPNIGKTVSIRPGMQWEKLLMYPYETERITNFEEQARFWFKKSFEFIAAHPARWGWSMIKKTILFFNSYEFSRNFDLAFFSRYSLITRLPFVKLNLILPLGLSTIFLIGLNGGLAKNRKIAALLILLLFSYAFSIIIFFIAARYRLPIIPFLIIFSAYYIAAMVEEFKYKRYLNVLKLTILAVSLSALTQIKFFKNSYPYAVNSSETYSLIGNAFLNEGKIREAGYFLQKGARNPADDSTNELYYYLGHYYSKIGDKPKAIECFKKSVELNPENYRALNSLGFEYKMIGEHKIAIDYLNRARDIAKSYPVIYLNLADCYVGQNDKDMAISILESYNSISPSPHPEIGYALGKLYMDLFQDWKKAIRHFEHAIKYPQGIKTSPETYNRLGACYYYINEPGKAKQAWLEGLKINPNYKAIKINLSLMKHP